MKRKISDMLDGYSENAMQMENSTPLSSQRIKELTMSKMEHIQKNRRRVLPRILVAAVLMAAMAMTAVAAEEVFGAGDWFRDILNSELREKAETLPEDYTIQEEISEKQLEIITELGSSFQPQTQTSEGTTVTLAAAYADEYVLHLYLQVQAPENCILPDGILYELFDHNVDIDYSDPDHWADLKPGKDAPYDFIGRFVSVEALPDEEPTDSKKDFHVTIKFQPGTRPKANDGYSKFFNITGIYEQVLNVDGDIDGYVRLAPGNFSFDVGIVNFVEHIQLDVAGLTYGGYKTQTWTHDSPCMAVCEPNLIGETDPENGLPVHMEGYNYEVVVEKLELTTLSAEWQVRYSCDNERKAFGLEFDVVMKDGTRAAKGTGGIGIADDGKVCNGVTDFAVPIDLEQVEYILIGDSEINSTHKVYLP